MSTERKFVNIGIFLAFSSTALGACGPEQNPATDFSVTVVVPGDCEEVLPNNIRFVI